MAHTTKDNYTLRRLLPSQWEDYKSIRLEALKTNPELFGSNYAKEAAYSHEDWQSLLENDARAMFALYHAKSLIGLSGVTLKKDDATTAVLFASFIKLPHRGNGLSKLFYQARIEWARQKECKVIIVSHRVGNVLSKAANQRFGFKYTHAEEVNWPDGVRAEELMYLLKLS
jgi:GNAT superfamily N-acetyltransferase